MPLLRNILISLGFSLAAITQPAAAQKVTVGLIVSVSGPLAPLGHQLRNGADLYVKQHQDRLPPGVTIDVKTYDDQGNPALAAEQAKQLIFQDKAQIIAGMLTDAEAAAAFRVASAAGIPLVVMGGKGLSTSALPPLAVRFATTFAQEAAPFARWAAAAKIKTAYALFSDSPAGHLSENAFSSSFKGAGGEISGSSVIKPQDIDLVPEIKRATGDATFVYLPVSKAAAAFEALRELRGGGSKILAMPEMVLDDALLDLGPAAEGVLSSGSYSAAASRLQNRTFVEGYRRVYGDQALPNVIAVDAWDGMAAIFGLLEATKGKFTGEQAIEFLQTWIDPTSPRGFVMIDPRSRDMTTDIYIRRVEMSGGRPANVEFQQVALVRSDGTGGGGDPCPTEQCRCRDRSCSTTCPCKK
jgi:branched-chain amino acid transport system substrate-binding protein